MASTTKIMTCITALEHCPLDYICTTSQYAASMPDVQMNLAAGEQLTLKDLLYGLMLKSYNDAAVVIAENVASYIKNCDNDGETNYSNDSKTHYDNETNYAPVLTSEYILNNTTDQSRTLVDEFALLMNTKASELGCTDTYFITPNGLDASNENGIHHTTAKELSVIMSYCIENNTFLEITQTPSYSFSSDKTSYSFNNANAFLNMYPNIISGKTGFTADAGYCYVCAYKSDGKTFIVSLLACGWPGNKTYKWKDSRLLLDYALKNYSLRLILSSNFTPCKISVENGTLSDTTITADIPYDLSLLISENDKTNIVCDIPDTLIAPVYHGSVIGKISVFINDELYKQYDVKTIDDISEINYLFFLKNAFYRLLFIDKT